MHSPTLSKEGSGFGLFDSLPPDHFQFGLGDQFNPRAVPEALGLKKEDISRIASVSIRSVRYDKAIPEQMLERLEEIGTTINLVATFFEGDPNKTIAWFKAKNPLLGDISPRDMIRLGRFDRLRKFIVNAMIEKSQSAYTDNAAV